MSDDKALLLHYALSRDAEAFAQLVHRYSGLVFSVACRVTGNSATAEDVTQDCFFALARQAASVHGSLPGWLHRVAMNLSLNVTRKEATRQRHEAQIVPASAPSNEPTWKQISPLIDVALAKLPDDLREPLFQHFLLGRTQTQVAKDLHIDQGTVSRRLLEGIKVLREHLRETGLVCGITSLTKTFANNASVALPAKLTTELAKMALAGPATAMSTATITAVLITNIKLIAAIVSLAVVGSVVAYHFVPSTQSKSTFTLRPYLSKLVLQGDGFTQDSFSLAFKAAAKVLGRDTDYETIYAMSTNAFCPAIAISRHDSMSFWYIQGWLGDKAINTLSARYGLIARNLDLTNFSSDDAGYCRAMAPIINQEMEAGNIVLVCGGWTDDSPYAGIITDVHSDGMIYGATLNNLLNNPLNRPRGVWSLAPTDPTLTPHEADIVTLRSAVARIRGQSPFKATPQAVYGMQAMDFWIKAMTETPGYCALCMQNVGSSNNWSWSCAHFNARTTQIASAVAAQYLRRIAPDFPPAVQSHLESAAAHYDYISALVSIGLANTGPDSYTNILGDLAKQKVHVTKVLAPIKSEYSAIARDLELALNAAKQ